MRCAAQRQSDQTYSDDRNRKWSRGAQGGDSERSPADCTLCDETSDRWNRHDFTDVPVSAKAKAAKCERFDYLKISSKTCTPLLIYDKSSPNTSITFTVTEAENCWFWSSGSCTLVHTRVFFGRKERVSAKKLRASTVCLNRKDNHVIRICRSERQLQGECERGCRMKRGNVEEDETQTCETENERHSLWPLSVEVSALFD